MAKVYLVSDSGHDYSKASCHGDVTVMFNDKVNVFASDRLVKDIEERLSNSEPVDFLLPSGNAMANCIAFQVMLRKHGHVNFLIYSFKYEKYEIRNIREAQFSVKVQ